MSLHADLLRQAQYLAVREPKRPLQASLRRAISASPEIVKVATAFVDLQQARHEADYDTARRFTRREVLDLLEQAQKAFEGWQMVRKSIQADTFLAGLLAFGNMRS